jgi:V8-like Glu-specific endopeptidase
MRKLDLLKLFLITVLSGPVSSTVFIGNNRKPLPLEHPASQMVGRLFLNGKRTCTASMVGRESLASAAHCFLDEKSKKFRPGNYVFKAGYSNGKAILESKIDSTKIVLGTLEVLKDPANDWAVARLENPIGDTTGWLEVKNTSVSEMAFMNWQDLQYVGYARDLEKGEVPMVENCNFTLGGFVKTSPQNFFLLNNCSFTPGGSGSPLIVVENSPNRKNIPYLYAIATASVYDKDDNPVAFSNSVANSSVPVERFYRAIKAFNAPKN